MEQHSFIYLIYYQFKYLLRTYGAEYLRAYIRRGMIISETFGSWTAAVRVTVGESMSA